jgi:hypothetical protein
MKKCNFFFFLVVFIFLNFSCKKQDITPAYLLLTEEDFKDCIEDDLVKFNNVHGQNYDNDKFDAIRNHNFKDVLVSLNGKELGYWQIPCKIPLLPNYSGRNNIRIIPCVRITHTSLTTIPYYFLSPVEQFFDMEKEGEYRLSDFKFDYIPSVEFPILETFSQTTEFKPFDTIYNTPMEIYNDPELKKNVGRIVLEDSVNFFNVVTSYKYLNGRSERQFWEIYYKCESGEMITYLNFRNTVTGTFQQDMIVFTATTTWKKAYIDIAQVVSQACGTADRISVCLGIRGHPNPDASKATFYFQNIKLVTMYAPY